MTITRSIVLDAANTLAGFSLEPADLDDLTNGEWTKRNGHKTAEDIVKFENRLAVSNIQRIGMVSPINGNSKQIFTIEYDKLSERIGDNAVKELLRYDLASLYDERDRLFVLKWPTKKKTSIYLEFSIHKFGHVWKYKIPDYRTCQISDRIVFTNGFDFSGPDSDLSKTAFSIEFPGDSKKFFSKPLKEIKSSIVGKYLNDFNLVN